MGYPELLVDAGRRMLRAGLTVETWGNISLRDRENGLIYVTPSAMPYDGLTPEDIVALRPDGSVAAGFRKPTVEAAMHLAVYAARPDLGAVLHTHPIQSMVFSALRREIPPILDEAAQLLGGAVRVADYALPGTPELAANCVRALGKGFACLLANHGAVCAGPDLSYAFKAARVLEMTAEVFRMARTLGEPAVLTEEQVAYQHDFALHRYGQ